MDHLPLRRVTIPLALSLLVPRTPEPTRWILELLHLCGKARRQRFS